MPKDAACGRKLALLRFHCQFFQHGPAQRLYRLCRPRRSSAPAKIVPRVVWWGREPVVGDRPRLGLRCALTLSRRARHGSPTGHSEQLADLPAVAHHPGRPGGGGQTGGRRAGVRTLNSRVDRCVLQCSCRQVAADASVKSRGNIVLNDNNARRRPRPAAAAEERGPVPAAAPTPRHVDAAPGGARRLQISLLQASGSMCGHCGLWCRCVWCRER